MLVEFDGFVLKNNTGKNGVAYIDFLDRKIGGYFNIGIPGGSGLKIEDKVHCELECSLREYEGSTYLKVVDVHDIKVLEK